MGSPHLLHLHVVDVPPVLSRSSSWRDTPPRAAAVDPPRAPVGDHGGAPLPPGALARRGGRTGVELATDGVPGTGGLAHLEMTQNDYFYVLYARWPGGRFHWKFGRYFGLLGDKIC